MTDDLLSSEALSALIGSIYDCALEPDRWDRTLVELKTAFRAMTAQIALLDTVNDRIMVTTVTGMDEAWQIEMSRHIAEINATMGRFLATSPSLDREFVLTRDMPRARFDASPYVQECLRPHGVIDILQLFFMNTPSRFSGFGMARHESVGPFAEHEIALGGLLLPHLRRAVTISNVLDARAIEVARMSETLDTLSCGVLLADERCGILHANRSAEAMLSAGTHIRAANGTLRAGSSAASKELREAVDIAARNETAVGKIGLAIRLNDDDAPPAFAHVLPMIGSEIRARLSPTAAAAIFIAPPPDDADKAEAMMRAYGLTPAETRVLANLLSGRTLSETATTLGVAATTAKTHLRNVFAKTGVTRQAELIRLARHGAPPARSA